MSEVETRAEPDYRRELYGTVLLLVVGAGSMLWVANRAWFTASVRREPPFGPITSRITGHHIYPALTGFALVALLTALLVLVTGGWPRRILGGLTVVVAGWTGWYAIDAIRFTRRRYVGLNDVGGFLHDRQVSGSLVALHSHAVWAWLSALCSVLLLVAGIVLMLRSGGWTGGLSRRYAAPAEAAAAPDPWRQLDRGEDPTIGNG